mgnify:CR=1 FL=1
MSTHLNLITDVPGVLVGNAHDGSVMSGVSVLLCDRPLMAAVDVRGGAPGTRETDALGLTGIVDQIHGIVLSGGSAFGLDAAGGVQCWLAQRGVGFAIGPARVPIVPQAILFDLLNGGDKGWGTTPPYRDLAITACETAGRVFALGSAGSGFGATTATLRGGLGSASVRLDDGIVIGALVAANPLGSVTVGDGPRFWAAPFERDAEFGGLGTPARWPDAAVKIQLKGSATPTNAHDTTALNTTIAIVATNAHLSKAECHRLAVMAQTGLARAIYPVHTPLDGDTVFAVATGDGSKPATYTALAHLGAHAANCLARAIARGIYEASPAPPGWVGPEAYVTRFPGTKR